MTYAYVAADSRWSEASEGTATCPARDLVLAIVRYTTHGAVPMSPMLGLGEGVYWVSACIMLSVYAA